MKIANQPYEPFVPDHYRCIVCGGDVHKDYTDDFDLNACFHYSCDERYDEDPDYDNDVEYDDYGEDMD